MLHPKGRGRQPTSTPFLSHMSLGARAVVAAEEMGAVEIYKSLMPIVRSEIHAATTAMNLGTATKRLLLPRISFVCNVSASNKRLRHAGTLSRTTWSFGADCGPQKHFGLVTQDQAIAISQIIAPESSLHDASGPAEHVQLHTPLLLLRLDIDVRATAALVPLRRDDLVVMRTCSLVRTPLRERGRVHEPRFIPLRAQALKWFCMVTAPPTRFDVRTLQYC